LVIYFQYGQLENNGTINSKNPVKAEISNVKSIAAGQNHSLALKGNGDLSISKMMYNQPYFQCWIESSS